MLNKYLLQMFKVNSLSLYQLILFKGLLIIGFTAVWVWEEKGVVVDMGHLLVFQHPSPFLTPRRFSFVELLLWCYVRHEWVGKLGWPSPA